MGPLKTAKEVLGPLPVSCPFSRGFPEGDCNLVNDTKKFASLFGKWKGICFEQKIFLDLALDVGTAFEAKCKEIMAGAQERPS